MVKRLITHDPGNPTVRFIDSHQDQLVFVFYASHQNIWENCSTCQICDSICHVGTGNCLKSSFFSSAKTVQSMFPAKVMAVANKVDMPLLLLTTSTYLYVQNPGHVDIDYNI